MNWLQLAKLRRAGDYPHAGQATMADIIRLKDEGRAAVRCYRKIHHGGLREASEAVRNLSCSG